MAVRKEEAANRTKCFDTSARSPSRLPETAVPGTLSHGLCSTTADTWNEGGSYAIVFGASAQSLYSRPVWQSSYSYPSHSTTPESSIYLTRPRTTADAAERAFLVHSITIFSNSGPYQDSVSPGPRLGVPPNLYHYPWNPLGHLTEPLIAMSRHGDGADGGNDACNDDASTVDSVSTNDTVDSGTVNADDLADDHHGDFDDARDQFDSPESDNILEFNCPGPAGTLERPPKPEKLKHNYYIWSPRMLARLREIKDRPTQEQCNKIVEDFVLHRWYGRRHAEVDFALVQLRWSRAFSLFHYRSERMRLTVSL